MDGFAAVKLERISSGELEICALRLFNMGGMTTE
jgi:hypothetical protein